MAEQGDGWLRREMGVLRRVAKREMGGEVGRWVAKKGYGLLSRETGG